MRPTLAILLAASSAYTEPRLPQPDHVVIVIEETHSYSQIIGSPAAPYINALAPAGSGVDASLRRRSPQPPNYLALFSGSMQQLTTNARPLTFSTPNLRSVLDRAGRTFGGYAEDLSDVGSTACASGLYVRTHKPWVNWQESSAHPLAP